MLTGLQWFYLISILLATFAGGYLPLFKQEKAKREGGFPLGEAFTAGVFIALALTLMLPSALHLLNTAAPGVDYPIAAFIAIVSFVFLLFLEHVTEYLRTHLKTAGGAVPDESLSPAAIPIIMTTMIAIPSFFLGTALGISQGAASAFIFVAVMTHKSSAGFSLALKMVRSTLTRTQTFIAFGLFACSTPLGIFFGAEVHQYLGSHIMLIIKGAILSLAAGTFLYMATIHEMQRAPMIEHCRSRKGFLLMLLGFLLTAFVRFLIGEAHRM